MRDRRMVLPLWIEEKIRVEDNGCWIWTGSVRADGYGRYAQRAAHRVVFERLVGQLRADELLHHRCETPLCVNPKHLKVVDRSSHLEEDHTVAGANRAKTHCPKGHPYEGQNLIIEPYGGRRCRTCRNERIRRRRARAKAAA